MLVRGVVVGGMVLLGACSEQAPPAAQVRPVRTATVERRAAAEPITLTGHIRARDEVSLGFRLDGKLIRRLVNVGDQVKAGQIVGNLDPNTQQNILRSAQADLFSAEASLTQARNTEERLRGLVEKGFTTRVQYEAAQQQLQAAEAQVNSAHARLLSAQDQVKYTELHAEQAGIVTATGAEPGEVVRSGQTIVRLAVQSGRDAVFDVPASLIRIAPHNPTVNVWLADDKSVRTTGRVREVAPQPDPVTRTYPVKVSLIDPPAAMRLGSTVTGSVNVNSEKVISLPGTALTRADGTPSVWVVDPQSKTVSLRAIRILRYDSDSVFVSDGLKEGEVVVTAGVHALRPGQKVRLLGASS
jgi:membrane fusion protein, multidrug efflux system